MRIISVLSLCVLLSLPLPQPHRRTQKMPERCEVPFEYMAQPDDITCGPTSAAMLLRHYGRPASVGDVAKVSRTKWFRWAGRPVGMTSPDYVAVALTHFGVPSHVRRGGVPDLERCVVEGRPPVVLVRSGNTTWHYVVVIGYDPAQFVLADPSGGRRRAIPREAFVRAWAFSHDLEGEPCGSPCPLCGGGGAFCICHEGRLDPLGALLRSADIYGQTYIAPDQKRE